MSKVFEPAYYAKFSCLGGACRYTCCQGWAITFTRAEYNKMRNLHASPELKAEIATGIRRIKKGSTDAMYSKMVFAENGLCPMLSAEGLCRLQIECGYNTLSWVCKTFPRLEAEQLGYWQRSCSTGCEQTLNLMLEEQGPLRFVEREDPTAAPLKLPNLTVEQKKKVPTVAQYPQIQAVCISILQNRAYTLDERMILLGLALQDFDEAVKSGTDGVLDWLRRRRAFAMPEGAEAMRPQLSALSLNANISVYHSLTLAHTLRSASMNVYYDQLMDDVFTALDVQINNLENGQMNLQFSVECYENAKQRFAKVTHDMGQLLEHVMVNRFFEQCLPIGTKSAWSYYVAFCCSYSLFRLMAVGFVVAHPKQESYIQALAVCSREIFHAQGFVDKMATQFQENGSDTLAHMAALVQG